VHGLDLVQRLGTELAGFQEQQFRVAEDGRQRIVHVVLHVRHVATEDGFALALQRTGHRLLRLAATSTSVCVQSSRRGT